MYFHHVVCTVQMLSILALGAEPGLGNVPQCYYCLDAVVKIHLIPELSVVTGVYKPNLFVITYMERITVLACLYPCMTLYMTS